MHSAQEKAHIMRSSRKDALGDPIVRFRKVLNLGRNRASEKKMINRFTCLTIVGTIGVNI